MWTVKERTASESCVLKFVVSKLRLQICGLKIADQKFFRTCVAIPAFHLTPHMKISACGEEYFATGRFGSCIFWLWPTFAFREKHDRCAFWLVVCTSTRRNTSDQAKLRNEGRGSTWHRFSCFVCGSKRCSFSCKVVAPAVEKGMLVG